MCGWDDNQHHGRIPWPGPSAEMCRGFFWALFPTKMRRKNPARKSAKKSGGSTKNKNPRKNPFCHETALRYHVMQLYSPDQQFLSFGRITGAADAACLEPSPRRPRQSPAQAPDKELDHHQPLAMLKKAREVVWKCPPCATAITWRM